MRADRSLRGAVPGSAASVLASGVAFLAPEEAVLDAMLAGWVAQQTSRLLAATTVEQRVLLVRRLVAFTNAYPWTWTPGDVEEWTTALVGRGLAHSTLRNYQMAVQLFCGYVTDRRYGWEEVCEQRFGTHPVQVFHEWNTAVHRDQSEARPGNRPLSRQELQRFFDYCDERVVAVGRSGRKGWLAAFRDAALFKTVYAFGLRRREVAMLDLADLSGNPHAEQFGRYGAVSVRYGKAMKGGPPRRRTVLTTMGWAAETLAEWVEEVRPNYASAGSALWPTERGAAISTDHINTRFAAYRDACGLPGELGPHCLRHSYITHLIEDGFDHLFVQQQVGHSWGSTTAGYTTVGSDYKNQGTAPGAEPGVHRSGYAVTDRSIAMTPAPKLGYAWHLRLRMAERNMFATTDLVPLLAERDVALSAAQVYRLVTQTPERLSLRTLMALCDILACSPNDLIEPVAATRRSRATGTSGPAATGAADGGRGRVPRRAEIHLDR